MEDLEKSEADAWADMDAASGTSQAQDAAPPQPEADATAAPSEEQTPSGEASPAPQSDEAPTADAAPADAQDREETSAQEPAMEQAGQAEIAAIVEAILFATDAPLPPARIAQVGEVVGVKAVKTAIRTLNERYEQAGSSFRIEEIGGGFQMLTLPEFHDVICRLTKARSDTKLSQAALETLAVIAYRQPMIRADVEAIRGVATGEVLRGLMEKQLVKIVGRADVIGRPMLYGTTRRFLDVFGLGSLEDLPRVEELRSGAREAAKPSPTAAQPAQAAVAEAPAQPADQMAQAGAQASLETQDADAPPVNVEPQAAAQPSAQAEGSPVAPDEESAAQ